MSRAKHRKKSMARKKFKQAATVTTTGAILVMSASPAMADEPVQGKQYTYLNLPALEELPPVPVAAPVVNTITGDMVAAEARKHLGANYVWGGESESEGGYDCSGLVFRAYADLGISVPRTSGALAGVGVAVPSLDQAQAGDILAWPGHVAIYIGNGQMIESSDYGNPVAERNVYGSPTIRRVLSGTEVAPAAATPEAPVEEVATDTITVQLGDSLSKIAPTVGTTWQGLYEDNKTVIGDNPDLIYPGQIFFVGGLPLTQTPVTVEEEAAVAASGVIVPGATLTSEYGPRWGTMHNGIDLAAPTGTPIYAAQDGVVITAEAKDNGFGQWVRVEGADGTITVYGHIDTWTVNAGDRVEAGQQIATVGNRGNSTGPHLHFEVHIGPGPINPAGWLAERGINF